MVTWQTLAAWERVLDAAAEGLDLTDPEDRAAYRTAVLHRTEGVRVTLVREVAVSLGATNVPTSRAGAARSLADTRLP